MAASLCPVYMLNKLTNYVKSSDIEHELDKILFRFLRDKIGKQQVPPLPLTPHPPTPHRHRGSSLHLKAHAHSVADTPRRC